MPDKQTVSKPSLVIGYIFRALIAYTAVLGLVIFICDAFRISIQVWSAMLICLVPAAVFAVMAINKWCFISGLGVIAVTLSVLTLAIEKPVDYAVESAFSIWNSVMLRLDNAGYIAFGQIELSEDLFSPELLSYTGIAFIAIFLSAVFTFSTAKKTRLIPMLVVGIAICSLIFTYNISSINWGFALILAALCGILVLKMYDSTYKSSRDKKTSLKSSALGGFAGFAISAMAFLLLVVPASSVKKQWERIDIIGDRLQYARAVISSLIIGEVPNMTDLGYLGNMDTLNYRDSTANERTFTGKEMLEVYAAYNTPVYLRSWVGSYYANNCWYSATNNDIAEYNSNVPKDFMPESLTKNFLDIVNPRLSQLNNFNSYSNHSDEGYLTMPVDVKNISSAGNLLFLPSIFNPDLGLLEFGSDDAVEYTEEWMPYHEGIVTTSWFNFNKEYRTVSYVPYYRNPDFDLTLENNLRYYMLMMDFITAYSNVTDPAQQKQVISMAEGYLDIEGIEYTPPTAVERYYAMEYGEQNAFMERNGSLMNWYNNYVRKHYLGVVESQYIYPTAVEITKNIPENGTTHDIVMAVIDWLSENCTYTLSPAAPVNTGLSAIDTFLGETREGYCVQFATAATLLLRTLNIPTRYAEGYVASEFERVPKVEGVEKIGNYHTVVCDYDAHAWIEVYIEGAGWMQYEATPVYYSQMYEPYSTSAVSSSSSRYDYSDYMTEELTELEDTEPVEVDTGIGTVIMYVGIVLIITAGIALVIMLIVHLRNKSIQALQKRHDVLNHAERGHLEKDEIRASAKIIDEYILQLLSIGGYDPEIGELPSEYALRIDIDEDMVFSVEFREIMMYMQKEEFGYGMDRSELKSAAEFMRQLWDKIYMKLNPFKRFWLRNIKRVI